MITYRCAACGHTETRPDQRDAWLAAEQHAWTKHKKPPGQATELIEREEEGT